MVWEVCPRRGPEHILAALVRYTRRIPGRQRNNKPAAETPLYGDGEGVPCPLPRGDVRITSLAVRPYADGRRMKLSFSLTPFLERSSLDRAVTNSAGDEVASLSLIEAMTTHFDFTDYLSGTSN